MPLQLPSVFPDFRKPTTVLRALILAKAIQVVVFFAMFREPYEFFIALSSAAVVFEPSLLLSLAVLYLLAPLLGNLNYGVAISAALTTAACATLAVQGFLYWMVALPHWDTAWVRSPLVAALITGLILMYFDWRARATAPVMLDARLQSLQARIRPHFLFNSINTVASFIRHDPKLAEKVLLDLSDLFRAVLAEERMTVPLRDELAFSKAYVDIEQMRLGERLQVEWRIDEEVPMERPVPVLVLQPLIENAVYHGVEPAADGGRVWVTLGHARGDLLLVVENTVCGAEPLRRGNHSALANITERLNLLYDGQADVRVGREGERFSVRIVLPDMPGTR